MDLIKKTLMTKKMKKVVLIVTVLLTVSVCADDVPAVVEMSAGWCWYPYNTYFHRYPFAQYYDPWYYPLYRSGYPYPYSYPDNPGWYGYNEYPFYPYGGYCFYNNSVVFNLSSRKHFDLSNIENKIPPLPGSAPITLRSEEDISLQEDRLNRFLFSSSTNNLEKSVH